MASSKCLLDDPGNFLMGHLFIAARDNIAGGGDSAQINAFVYALLPRQSRALLDLGNEIVQLNFPSDPVSVRASADGSRNSRKKRTAP